MLNISRSNVFGKFVLIVKHCNAINEAISSEIEERPRCDSGSPLYI